MEVTVSGRRISVKELQPLKELLWIYLMVSGRRISVRAVQPLKTPEFTADTEQPERSSCCSAVQREKAHSPMKVILSGMLIEISPVQPAKAE